MPTSSKNAGQPQQIILFWTAQSSLANIEQTFSPQEFKQRIDELKQDVDVTKIATYLAHTVEERKSAFKTIL